MDKAKKALFECKNALNFAAFVSAWASFLIHTGSVLHALETGADITAQARQWYGGVKRQGRADPLVSYMHQARNAEEHQRAPVAGNAMMPGFGLVDHKTKTLEPLESLDDPFKAENSGKTIGIGFHGAGPFVKALIDSRYNQVFPPPDSHNGKPLKSNDPVALGEIYLNYLSRLVEKAEEMA